MGPQEKLLEVRNLKSSFFTYAGEVHAVQDVSFSLNRGEVVGIIGESGCGKSATALSIIGLLPDKGRVKSGEILFNGEDILRYSTKEMSQMRGSHIAMVFQDSMTSLNPVFTIGSQMSDVIQHHQRLKKEEAQRRCIQLLDLVGIPFPEKHFSSYPHELSGGMRQRVNIAMALSCEPELLLADEPTTALDVTLQAQILDLMHRMTAESNTAVLLITHDLSVIANTCSRVLVMYAGKIVEEGPVESIFAHPRHPYTAGLLKTVLDLNKQCRGNLFCINGLPPQLVNIPKGCPFADRCSKAMQICEQSAPPVYEVAELRVRCWLFHDECPSRGETEW